MNKVFITALVFAVAMVCHIPQATAEESAKLPTFDFTPYVKVTEDPGVVDPNDKSVQRADIKKRREEVFNVYQQNKKQLEADHEKQLKAMNFEASDMMGMLERQKVVDAFEVKKKALLTDYRAQVEELGREEKLLRLDGDELMDEPIAQEAPAKESKPNMLLPDTQSTKRKMSRVRQSYVSRQGKNVEKKSRGPINYGQKKGNMSVTEKRKSFLNKGAGTKRSKTDSNRINPLKKRGQAKGLLEKFRDMKK